MKSKKENKQSDGLGRKQVQGKRESSVAALKNILKSGLYIIATPIGNLRDITLRAIDTLRDCDVILCEDTRVTRTLLQAYDIRTPTVSYHDHSDEAKRGQILRRLKEGQAVALVSDAGMPLISDPGYKLVQACMAEGIYVTSLPGANAPLAALQLSGLPSDRFCFLGFLPAKSGARRKALEPWKDTGATLIFFESPQRLSGMLADLGEILPGRDVAVVREITKMFEEVRRGSAAELVAHYAEAGAPRGEVVVLAGPPEAEVKKVGEKEHEERLRRLLGDMKTKDAADTLAKETELSRKEAYALALRVSRGEA